MTSRNHLHLALIAALAAALAGCSDAPAQGTHAEGEALFNDYCQPCHENGAVGNASIAAPSIAGLPEWYVAAQVQKFRSGLRGRHFDDLEGMRMRPMALALENDQQVADVSAYIASLPIARPAPTLVGGNADAGKAAFGTCTACHQADGTGNQALGSPPLTSQPDWYLATQIHKFQDDVRGASPGDTTGATMRPMADLLKDEQAIKDVIAHVQTLGK